MRNRQSELSAGPVGFSQDLTASRKRRRAVATAIISAISLVDCTSQLLGATTTSTWVGDSNANWNNAANWNPSAEYPNNGNNSISDFSVVINSAGAGDVEPNLNINVTIDALTIGTGASLGLNGNLGLTLNSTLTNNGQIVVDNNQFYSTTLTPTGTIGGNGSIDLDSSNNNAILTGTFTNGSSQTIEGTGLIDAALTNDGTVNANTGGSLLDLQSDNMTNNLTMEATGAGTLSINGITITQGSSGKILASNGVVDLSSATISGGTLTTSSGGVIQTSGGTSALTGPITNSGALNILGNTNLNVTGNLTNNGTITLNSNQSYGSDLTFSGTTLSGTGTVILDSSGNGAVMAGSLTQASGHTIDGEGQITASLTNNGTVDANFSTETLTLLSSNMTNNSTMEATSGGILNISQITVTQGTSGELIASNGTVDLNSATMSAGTLNTSSGGIIQTTGGTSAFLGPITNSGTLDIQGNTNLNVTGNLTNNGTITLNNNQIYSSDLTFSASTLSGTGTLILNSSGNGAVVAGSLTQASGHTIDGEGQIEATFTNNGTVDANFSADTLTLFSNNMTNNSTMEATSGGILNISQITVTQGTSGKLIASNGTVDLYSATMSGGTLTTASGGIIQTTGGTSALLGPITNSSTLDIQGNTNLNVTGNLTDNGTITLNNNQIYSSDLTFSGTTLSGTGTIILDSTSNNALVAGTLTQSSGHTISGYGEITATLTNNGLVNANVSTAVNTNNTLFVSGASMTNAATMEATTGVLAFNSGVVVTNTGGNINAAGSNVVINNATITGGTLNATSPSVIQVQGATFGALTISANSTVDLDGNYNLTLNGSSLTDNGTLVINDNQLYSSALQVNANTLLTGTGSVVLDSTGSNADIATGTGDTLTLDTHQTISGEGEITASFINNGTVNANVNNQTFTLQTNGMTNNSLMEATGGSTLLINGITITQSSSGQISASNGTVDLSSATLSGGTLKTSAGGVIQTTSGTTSALSGVTNSGSLNVGGNSNLNTSGNFINNGVVSVDPNTFYNSELATTGPITGTGSLAIYNGGLVKLGTNTGQSIQNSLTISADGQLDIANNHLIINYGSGSDPMATIYAYLKSGYAGGNWNGYGIESSAATAENGTNGAPKYGLGWSDSADKIDGHTIVTGLSSGEIEIKYTLVGDANLDGVVNGSDFSILAANFGQGYSNWDQGNFLFTPAVNGTDFSALAANFGQGDSGADVAVSAADIAALNAFAVANGLPLPTIAAVPEPASAGVALGAIAVLAARRRRRSHSIPAAQTRALASCG